MFPRRRVPKSLVITYISVFGALNAFADFIPISPVLGIPGSSLTLNWMLSPLTGILLGPEIGGISCLVGGLVIIFLGQPPLFGPFTPFRPAVSASIAGMLAYGNWHLPAVALLSLILVWLLLPIGAEAFVVLTFHMAGLAMILLLRGKIEDLLRSTNHKKASLGSFSAAYCGNISRHLFGNILSATMLKMPSLFFILALPYTFVEQLIFATGASIIGVSLSKLGLREVLQPRDP